MSALDEGGWRSARPELHGAIVCDGLLPWAPAFLPPGADLVDVLGRFHRGGVHHVSITVAAGKDTAATALATLGFIQSALQKSSQVVLARAPAEIREAHRNGRISVGFHFQTSTPMLADLTSVQAFYAAGVDRAILAYNEANEAADGCHEPRDAGLSQLGRRLVKEMDRVGMLVDLSHCGKRTTLEAMELTQQPPFFSHSNARALADHERNITDEQIRACARRKGYIGVNGVGMFIEANSRTLPATIAQHAAYIADIAGAECVGLGLDFMYLEGSDYSFFHKNKSRWPRGYPNPPWDFLQPEQLGDLVNALYTVGFQSPEVSGILGENYLRVLAHSPASLEVSPL